ncbi:MAG: urease accessory protein UreE [Myxococcales bacterium]|nr:urease accessory protein UreE [Myxococcales bacterium]MCB9734453.1 urease accessory protein UreE [Deltaproteobacteria bacterium]
MLEAHDRLDPDDRGAATVTVTLAFADRQRSRLRARLDDGRELGIFLPRGTVLRDGDRLVARDGTVVAVQAAAEPVSIARAATWPDLVRAAYHLGNRHVPLEVGDGWLRFGRDHVLDQMVRGLGLLVAHEEAPFEPEPGAYGGHGPSHGHAHAAAPLAPVVRRSAQA